MVRPLRFIVLAVGAGLAWAQNPPSPRQRTRRQQRAARRQALADQVNALYKARLKSEIAFSFAEVNVSEAKLILIRAPDALKRAYAELARAMGAPHSYKALAADQRTRDLQQQVERDVRSAWSATFTGINASR